MFLNFHAQAFLNNNTFYIDDNGYEMMSKNISQNSSNSTNSTQFYPVHSAIAMKDNSTGKEFTIMTDHTQNGTATTPGNFKLIHMTRFDNFAASTYYLQLLRLNSSSSEQRLVQMRVDDPPQYLYNNNVTYQNMTSRNYSQKLFSKTLNASGISGQVKAVFSPIGLNNLNLTIKNMDDSFDSSLPRVVNMTELVFGLWTSANNEPNSPMYTSV